MRLTVNIALTLDGVMQGNGAPDADDPGFDKGGWQIPYVDGDVLASETRWFEKTDAFLLGRRTYEIFAAHWGQVTDPADPIATRLNALPKYVTSTTLSGLEWHNSTLISGDVATEVARLKQQPGNELQVIGSGVLVRTLIEHDLVDEYRLWIYPVFLGGGRRLFTDGVAPRALRLVDTQVSGTGAVLHVYQPAGKPEYRPVRLEDEGGVVRDQLSQHAAS